VTSEQIVTGGSIAEAIGGIAAVILAIIGLANVWSGILAGITAIVLGGALLFQGGAIMLRFSRMLSEEAPGTGENSEAELGGTSAEVIGGLAGIVLAILALVNVVPYVLLPVAAIVYGGTMMLACGTNAGLSSFSSERFGARNVMARRLAADMLMGTNGLQVMVGIAAVVLGIIGVVGFYSVTLSLVAYLCVGVAVLASGTALTSKMLTLLRRW
jgi:hypothetical protein